MTEVRSSARGTPEMDTSYLSTLGFVISHGFVVAGMLPTRIAFPCLARSLLGSDISFTDEILFDSFIDSISAYDLSVVKKAQLEVGQCPETRDGVIALFSRFNSWQLPAYSYV